jgi:hypothetical protein
VLKFVIGRSINENNLRGRESRMRHYAAGPRDAAS